MTSATVSVIIPAYNQANYLAEALRSVLAQTRSDWEAIIVDDGSTDHTAVIAAGFNDARVRYIYQANQGLSGARNTGVQIAGGEYLAFLDSDDELEPEFLQVCVEALETDRTLAAVHTLTRFIDQAGKLLPDIGSRALVGEAFRQQLRRGGFFPPVSVVVRKEAVLEAGLFDTRLTSVEDWDVWLKISQRHPMRGLARPLVRYRVYPGSMSTNAPRMLANRLMVIAKHVGDPTGDPNVWPDDKRQFYGHAYLKSALEHIQQHQFERGWELAQQAVTIWPPLLTRLDTFYELACGDQIKGYRSQAARLNIEGNGQAMLTWLDRLFAAPTPPPHTLRGPAYGNAHLALGLLFDRAGQWGAARRHVAHAVTSSPRLLSYSVLRRFIKLCLGQRLVTSLRTLRTGKPSSSAGSSPAPDKEL
jgi:glycosyltransferase involved in cell wall biosynthesis